MISAENLLTITLVIGHLGLFALLWQRRGDHRQRRIALIGWLVSNIAIISIQFVPTHWYFGVVNDMMLTWIVILIQTGFLGHFMHYEIALQYPFWQRRLLIWWTLVFMILGTTVGSLVTTNIAASGWVDLTIKLQDPTNFIPTGIMLSGIILLNGILSIAMMVNFYRANMPELANRVALIVLLITTSFVSHFVLVSGIVLLHIPVIFLLMILGTTLIYINHYYRVFDVRQTLLVVLESILVTLLAGGMIFIGSVSINQLPNLVSSNLMVLVLFALLLATLHIPIRQFTHIVIAPIHRQEQVDLGKIIRQFSRQIASAANLDEVITATQSTLDHTMQIRRTAFILINNTFRHPNSAELIVLGQEQATQTKYTLHHKSPIFKSLAVEHVPIGVYDLRFNPIYKQANPNEHAFFATLKMSVYIPIVNEGILLGILACDTKADGAAYTRDDVYKLTIIGEQIGTALRNTRLIDDLQHLNTSMSKLNQRLEDAKLELEKLDSVKTDFITIASHELRTPLAQIRGYADIIDSLNEQGSLEKSHTNKIVANLRKSTERMEELITAMLDVSQLDVDAMDLHPVNTTAESLIKLAIDPLNEAFTQRNLTLVREGLETLPNIHVDMQRVVQAFRNLIVNAIKFTPDGGTITIKGINEPAKDNDSVDHIIISIQDTGIGIEEKNLTLIFNKFFRGFDTQLHSTGMYKFMGAGPGLGLTIARGIIEGHGGTIWADSDGYDLDKLLGAQFYVRIPIKPPEGTSGVLAIQNDKVNVENIKRTEETSTVNMPQSKSESIQN